MSPLTVFTRLIRRFHRDDNASVTVESALMLPMLIWWFIGSFVFFDAFKSYNQALKASYTVSDLLSRQLSVSETYMDNLNELFATMVFTSEDTWIRISAVEQTVDGYEVVWSYATGGNDDLVDDDIPTERFPDLVESEIVILTETFLPYTPAFNVDFAARTWENQIVARPRFASTLTNSG